MQQPLQIAFHGVPHSDAVEQRIRVKVDELERFCDDITSCQVTVEAPHHRHHKGNLYSIRLEIHVPGDEVIVGRKRRFDHAHEDVYVAIRDAFGAAVRQLEDYVRVRRRKVKRHEVPEHGNVSRLFPDAGYGFIRTPDGTDVYFHENSVVGAELRALEVGDQVRIVIAEGEGEKGPQASTVIPVGKHHVVGEATS